MTRRWPLLIGIPLLLIAVATGCLLPPLLDTRDGPSATAVGRALADAPFPARFRPDLPGGDDTHRAEGRVGVGHEQIAFSGTLAPVADYTIYLSREYIEHRDAFLRIKGQAQRIGAFKHPKRFLLDVPQDVDVEDYTTVVIWSDRTERLIAAAQYRGIQDAMTRED